MERTVSKCPACGSTRIAPISYGLPDFTEELMRRVENEEVYLGGCLIFEGYPEMHCFACGKNIASMPVLCTRQGREDYRRIVTGFRFLDRSAPGGSLQLVIGRGEGGIRLEIRRNSDDPQSCYGREMTEGEWKDLPEQLYTRLYLHEWNRVYIKRDAPQSDRWELEIRLTGDRSERYLGLGGYPPFWEEFRELLRPFFREAGIEWK